MMMKNIQNDLNKILQKCIYLSVCFLFAVPPEYLGSDLLSMPDKNRTSKR